jgi:DNA/RNA endonuclease YhcR with UshA esterase domain
MAARSNDALEYTTFTSAIDLYAVKGRDIEKLVVVAGTGTITCLTKGSPEVNRVYSVAPGDVLDVQIRSIVSVSSVTKVRAYFGDF